ncbi:MAG: hypothetical protein PHV06_12330 [bacterium]|nr:hypothetical protein [bacterium]
MKPTPVSGMIVLLIQLIFISITDITVFPFFLFILVLLLILSDQRLKNLKRLVLSEIRIIPLILFIGISYSFLNDLPRLDFSYIGFLSFLKIAFRLVLMVGFITEYFFFYSEGEIISELNYFSQNIKSSGVREILQVFILTIFLFKPVLENERKSRKFENKFRFSFRKTGDYLFQKFIEILQFCNEKSKCLEESLNSVFPERRSLEHTVVSVLIVSTINILFIFGSDYFHNLKGIF